MVHVICKQYTTQQQLECLCAHLLHAAGPAQESVERATYGETNAPVLRPAPHSSLVLHCRWPCNAQQPAQRSGVLKIPFLATMHVALKMHLQLHV